MKKLTSILLALLMALTLLPTAVFAETTTATALPDAVGGVYTLTSDVTLSQDLKFEDGGNYTIDLGGKTLTFSNSRLRLFHGTLTIKNGTITGASQPINVYGGSNANDSNYSVLNLESGTTVNGDYGVCVFAKETHGTSNRGFAYGAVVNLNGATVKGSKTAVFVQGYIGGTSSDAEVMKKDNIATVNINSGTTITATGEQGIAVNGLAKVNVYDGASITGREAIGVKRGILNVNGGTLKATGNKIDPATANHNGTEATGAAISVTSTYSNYGAISVNVSGGTIESVHNAAVYQGHSVSNNAAIAYSDDVKVNITGGTFTSGDGVPTVYIADKITNDVSTYTTKVISGGTFNDPCALNFAKSGANVTIKLDKDMTENVVVPAGVTATLDLNGFTLNGGKGNSSATVTNNGTLTITDSSSAKTGTIKREDVGNTTGVTYYVIENKGEMTIEQANVINNSGYEDENAAGKMRGSALICNSTENADGTLTIEGGTFTQNNFVVVKNDERGVLTVNGGTFNGNESVIQNWKEATLNGGTVNGKIWTAGYRSGNTDFVGKTVINNVNHTGEMVLQAYDDKVTAKPSLEIKGGTFSFTEWTLKQGTEGTAAADKFSISITGGTFAINPKDYVAENYAVTEKTANGTTTYTVSKKLADYTEVDKAIKDADNYKGADYTTDSYAKLTDAIAKVDRTKTYDQQNDVNAMAKAINDAIAGLVKRVATNTGTNKNETSSTVNESTATITTSGTGENATTTVTHTIDATTGSSNETTTAIVNVPTAVVTAMANSAADAGNVSVVIKTDVGTITLDKAALKAITDNLDGVEDTVTELRMTVKDTTDDNNANHTKRYEVTIEAVVSGGGTTSVYSSSNSRGSATVTVEYTQQNANKRVYVYYVENGVAKERMNATYVDGKLTWTTTHFSTFEVREAYPPRVIHHGGAASSTTTTDKSTSPTTFDAGIAIYGVMAVSSVLGMGYMGKKKFF